MTKLSEFTEDELKEELKRRELELKKPEMLKDIDMDRFYNDLYLACRKYVDCVASDDFHEDHLDNYRRDIFETAMEIFYGRDIWEWINERIG